MRQADAGAGLAGGSLRSVDRREEDHPPQRLDRSAIEASKIAGHSKVDTTLDYTIIGGKRHETLTRRIQEMRAKAAKKSRKVVEIKKPAVA